MNTPGTRQSDWRAVFQPVLAELEAQRRSKHKKVITAHRIIATIAIIAIFSIAALAALNNVVTPLLALIPAVAASVVYAHISSTAAFSYKTNSKSWVLPKLVEICAREVGGVLEYSHGAGISEAEFNGSQLFRSPDRFHSEDLIFGNIGETKLRFSEVHAGCRNNSPDIEANDEDEYHTIFNGLFFVADFNKDFQGATVVLPDTMQSLFGRLGQKMQEFGTLFSGRGQLVKLEDPNFEQAFAAYSTDQTEARYILSPALMQRLLLYASAATPIFASCFRPAT